MARKNQNKTTRNNNDVIAFLNGVEHPTRRADGITLLQLFEDVTGLPPAMWGDSIVGFGSYHYRYDSGREGDFLRTGFSPRKQNLSLYCMSGFKNRAEILARLGKFKTGRGCLYINKLADVDLEVLKELIAADFAAMQALYPED